MRALIAGLGAVGQRHARNLRALRPDVELIAWRQRRRPGIITDAMELAPGEIEQEIGIESFDDLDSALATRPEIAIICNPTSQHAQTALGVAAAGCHLFIEKPVSHSLDGLARLSGMAERQRLVVAMGCQWRFHPMVERMRTVLASASLGKVTKAEIDFSEYLPDWHPYEDYRASYAARAELGGGVVLTQIHDYDLAYWLFGPARSVLAGGTDERSLGLDVEESMRSQLDCEQAPVVVRQSFAEPGAKKRTITVHAAAGSVTCDLVAARLTSTVPGVEAVELKEFARNAMFRSVMEDFLRCIDSGGTPRIPLADGIAVLKLALAVKESARRRMPMQVA
jgi:predicted dehydrogenase